MGVKWYRCRVGGYPLLVTEEWAAGRADAVPVDWRPSERLRRLAERLPKDGKKDTREAGGSDE